ncbi:hypothetical protein [Paenibacillus sp. R14(2021)]|uniref:hypothetical protein n=1 Tax=Paenibacillus sp. R14(2021) TaxID=2859228 RepID=UPI001C612881|nr:hypothetical protein [Paenibacillus sp. R14(2021)]
MTLMLIAYAAFLVIGLITMKRSKAARKEKAALFTITSIGAVLWASILLEHPLDLNRLIGWLIQMMF